jgi:hypothetical protein
LAISLAAGIRLVAAWSIWMAASKARWRNS